MKINVHLDDELFEHYVKQWGVPGIYSKIKQYLELCKDIQKDDRTILISGDARRALEAVFQTTVDDAAKLVKLVQNMSRVAIGDVSLDFTSDELARLAAQAGFHGRTLDTYIRETVQELKDMMLEKV